MVNNSGIHPTGSLVLILLDQVPTQYGSVVLPAETVQRDQLAQIRAIVIEIGPQSLQCPPVGTRIIFKRYAGELVTGEDGVFYRVINDKDIYATLDKGSLATQH